MNGSVIFWDYNGCILDDCEWIYTQGPVRIFSHFGLQVPSLDVYRNEVESDFMRTFYWKYGVPKDKTAADLDAIMKEGYDAHGEPPMQPDAMETLEALRKMGCVQHLITGFESGMLKKSLAHHGSAGYFNEIHSGARKKIEIFQDILRRSGVDPADAVGVTDSLSDVVMLEVAGVRAFICPRGFHGRARIDNAVALHPNMVVIDDLASLLSHL